MIRETVLIAASTLLVTACGAGEPTKFYSSDLQDNIESGENESSDATAEMVVVQGSEKTVTKRLASYDETAEEDETPPTAEDVLATCKNATVQTLVKTLVFPAYTNMCQWGTKVIVDGVLTPVLSANGNLPILDGWVRAREEQTQSVDAPVDSLICGVDLVATTDTIHFDDFFAIRANEFVIAGSKRLTDSLEKDADDHYVWNWPKIRGDGSAATGTPNSDNGKYFLTGTGDLPPTDQPGKFSLQMSFAETEDLTDPVALSKAALFAKLTGKPKLDFTMVATGDNDNSDCFHSGGSFVLTLKYVTKTKKK